MDNNRNYLDCGDDYLNCGDDYLNCGDDYLSCGDDEVVLPPVDVEPSLPPTDPVIPLPPVHTPRKDDNIFYELFFVAMHYVSRFLGFFERLLFRK